MCGIAGFVRFCGENKTSDTNCLEEMVQTLYHRGPDEKGLAIHHGVAMGMRRLAIIDLSGGTQPIYNEDKSIWTVFNGEIYNFPQLKKELQQYGHIFRTDSDTEVIVHGYEQWGADFVKRLNGMFAIALHDMNKKCFILARDHLGIKPLYFSFQKDRLLFGSEIKALLTTPWVQRSLNMEALAEFLAWEYTPGTATLFKDIQKLLPGQLLHINLNAPQCSPKSFWDIPLSSPLSPSLSEHEWEEKILAQVQASTQMQMISDVPLGAFLSGGVDSSLIAACMGKVQTFSIGFDDPTYNELTWARKVADHIGVEHRDEIIRPDIVSLFDQLMHFMDDPIGDFSIFPTFLVSQLARRHVTVALSGDGGDELFAGYESYLAQEKARIYQRIPAWMRQSLIEPIISGLKPSPQKKGLVNKAKRFIEGAAYPESLSHARWRLFVSDTLRENLLSPDALQQVKNPAAHHIEQLFQQAGNRGELDQSLYVDVKSYLSDNILTKVDRMSMAVSLETRVPLLDKDLVEMAFQVPENFKLSGNETKSILKKVASRLVPKECIYRPKEGFSIPIKHWLNTEFKPLMDEHLNKQSIDQGGIFQWPTIKRLKQEHSSGQANHSHILWALIVFHDWNKRWC
ncbi:asparagine synthase (glutamine-hydrolyzing) [Desulfogranum marinum]|uniref:asparagine synthase (glutamine-hydrolyzing) n=1 Tax=Desulfogranum marinum TaxID=453220 RepID=UPI0029C914CC|nr:asparagine synthase (glutamine-hydrolyzing) [Desulfogranum marinum]